MNFIGGERQRRHESDLDFERRVWDEKSEALFIVMRVCHNIADDYPALTEANRKPYALNLSRRLDALAEVRPTIEAFASRRCSDDLSDLIDELVAAGVKYHEGRRAHILMEQVVDISLDDTAAWERNRAEREKSAALAMEHFAPDLDGLRYKALRLLEAARESVRRPKDGPDSPSRPCGTRGHTRRQCPRVALAQPRTCIEHAPAR